jgi:transposase
VREAARGNPPVETPAGRPGVDLTTTCSTDAGFEVMLVNARHVKNLPGRKSDVSDAAWLAQLGAHGLLRGSFVPPAPIRELRDLTRARTMMTREPGREIQRLEKLMEDAAIKLSSVASDITGVSGRLMLQALIDGHRDPAVLANLAKRRLRAKIPKLTETLTGRFTEHHAFSARMYLAAIDQRSQHIADLTARIEVLIEPFRSFCDLIRTIPGIAERCAEVIVAETGADLSIFPTAAHLASWAGTFPGSNESAGQIKSTTTRPGNPYLKAALGTARRPSPTPEAPTSPQSTDASPPGADPRKPSLPSNTPS